MKENAIKKYKILPMALRAVERNFKTRRLTLMVRLQQKRKTIKTFMQLINKT